MGRTVLAVAQCVMREDEQHRQLHESGEADRRACIVAEDEECRGEGPQLRERQPVRYGTHGVLANSEMQIAPPGTPRLKVPGAGELEGGSIRWSEIGRSA